MTLEKFKTEFFHAGEKSSKVFGKIITGLGNSCVFTSKEKRSNFYGSDTTLTYCIPGMHSSKGGFVNGYLIFENTYVKKTLRRSQLKIKVPTPVEVKVTFYYAESALEEDVEQVRKVIQDSIGFK